MVDVKKIPPLQCPKCKSTKAYDCSPSYSRKKIVRCDDCNESTETGKFKETTKRIPWFAGQEPDPAALNRRGRKDKSKKKTKKGFADHQLPVDRFMED